MKKIKLKKSEDFLKALLNSISSSLIFSGHRWPSIFLYSETDVSYHVIIEKVNMTKWNILESITDNDPNLERVIYINGWINKEEKEKGKRYSNTVARNCMIYFYADDKIYLLKKKKK